MVDYTDYVTRRGLLSWTPFVVRLQCISLATVVRYVLEVLFVRYCYNRVQTLGDVPVRLWHMIFVLQSSRRGLLAAMCRSPLCNARKSLLTRVPTMVRPLLTRWQTSVGDILVPLERSWTAKVLQLLLLTTCPEVLSTRFSTLAAGACRSPAAP